MTITTKTKRHSGPAARECILREAEHLIHVRGFNRTSLDDIACSCGMTKANLLHHFESKEALGLAVLDFKIAAYRCGCLDSCFKKDCCPFEAIRELFSSAGRFYAGNGCRAGCFVGNMALEMSDINERFRRKAEEFFREWSARIADCLADAQARGQFKAEMDPKALSESILALYEGASMLARTLRDSRVFRRTGAVAEALLSANAAGSYEKNRSNHREVRPR